MKDRESKQGPRMSLRKEEFSVVRAKKTKDITILDAERRSRKLVSATSNLPQEATPSRVLSLESHQASSREKQKDLTVFHQLQMRVDDETLRVIEALKERAEAETLSELVRTALRAYELTLAEYDEIHASSNNQKEDEVPVASKAVSRSAQSTAQPKTHRLNIQLREAPMTRLKRLERITEAPSQAEVVRYALSVLKAKLDYYDSAIRSSDARSSVSLVNAG